MAGAIRILHVDDDGGFVEMAATFLEREDERFSVETATSADEALAILDDRVDCVVSDYEMPGTDGVELLETVRDDHPDLPFVLYTGKGSEEVASEAISAGVTDYLQKETGTSQYAVLANRIANAVEQHRSKEALEESRQRLSMYFEQSPLGVIEWTLDYEFARVNAAAEEILGYEEQELLGESWEKVIPASDREEVGDVLDALHANVAGYHNVNENVREDGEVIVCEWHNRVITGAGGEPVALFSQFQDVTERTEREWQLERHRENLEGLLEAANRLYAAESVEECYEITIESAVTILGFDWCTLAAPADDDPDAFEIHAISEETPLGVGDRPFATDEGIAGHVYQTKDPWIVEDARDTERGEPTTEEIRSALTVPVADWGIFQAVATTPDAFDDQDRKHAELLVASMLAAIERVEQQAELRERQRELERQNDRLDEFASVVSHDLRNPLTVADGRLDLAMEEVENEHLDAVQRSIDRMQTLVEDLLALARHGETPTEAAPVELANVVERSWAAVETGDARLVTDVDAAVRADEGRLRQLFENLFRNSIEHGRGASSSDGSATVETTPEELPEESTDSAGDATDADSDPLTVTVGSLDDGFFVEDDGVGIQCDDREHLFDFGYSSTAGGTGLGLSIVAQVVDAHDWSIRATESPDGGARFEVEGVGVVE